jgi:hypothetical protein
MLGVQSRLARGAVAVAAAGIGCFAGAVTTATAGAATIGPPGNAFYTPPAPLPDAPHGTLIWYRPATLRLLGAPPVTAWTVLYLSQRLAGEPDAVTGTVIAPSAPWTGPGPRPVVDYAVGTQGLDHTSAPSLQLVRGTEYEELGIDAALSRGWAVEVTDYAGYTNGAIPDYIVGQSEGHAVLDIDTAARQIPGSGIDPHAPRIIWGYSQGGGASAWAAQLWPGYDRSMDLIGDAAGGVPSNLDATAEQLNGHIGAPFLLFAAIGLNTDYPAQIRLDSYLNPAGIAAVHTAETEGLLGDTQFVYKNIDQYTKDGETLDQLLAVPSIQAAIVAQLLGAAPIKVPMFHYHARSDEIVPFAQDEQLNGIYCGLGDTVDWQTYPGGHLLAYIEGMPDALAWIAGRFAGEVAPDNCSPSPALP